MKVGELKKAIKPLDDTLEIWIEAGGEEDVNLESVETVDDDGPVFLRMFVGLQNRPTQADQELVEELFNADPAERAAIIAKLRQDSFSEGRQYAEDLAAEEEGPCT